MLGQMLESVQCKYTKFDGKILKTMQIERS